MIKRKNNVFELYDKTLLSIGNVHKITKLSQFWVDMHSWKGAWLRNGTRGYRKFGLKRCARLQRKSNETVRRDLLALRTYRAKCLGGADSPPPPASLFKVKEYPWVDFVHTWPRDTWGVYELIRFWTIYPGSKVKDHWTSARNAFPECL